MLTKDQLEHLNRESSGLSVVGHSDLNGHGDAMHVNLRGGLAYVGHMGDTHIGTSVVDVSNPRDPRVVHQLSKPEGIRSHKVQVLDDILLVNYEVLIGGALDPALPTGLKVFSLADPIRPEEIAFMPMPGHGVHRMKFTTWPYAFMSGSDLGFDRQFFMVVDLSDPAHPKEVSRWWLPGMNRGMGEAPTWHAERSVWHHHASIVGDRAYCAWWDAGLVILDISDIDRPELVTHMAFDDLQAPPRVSGATHGVLALPERNLLVVCEEEIENDAVGCKKYVHLIDISDELRPRRLSILPEPIGDFAHRGGRYGPHNMHEMRPGTYQNSDELFVTYFNAGVRVYDISDPYSPQETAYLVPPSPDGIRPIQMNDLIVGDDGLIYATDRFSGGLYVIERS